MSISDNSETIGSIVKRIIESNKLMSAMVKADWKGNESEDEIIETCTRLGINYKFFYDREAFEAYEDNSKDIALFLMEGGTCVQKGMISEVSEGQEEEALLD